MAFEEIKAYCPWCEIEKDCLINVKDLKNKDAKWAYVECKDCGEVFGLAIIRN